MNQDKNTSITDNSNRNPLSAIQHQMWVTSLMVEDLPIFNIVKVLKINMDLDISLIELTISEIIKENPILTNTLKLIGEVPYMISQSKLYNSFFIYDAVNNEDEAINSITEICKTPIKLESNNLFKVYLTKYEEDKYILAICTHHIICDGLSLDLIFDKIMNSCLNKFPPKSEVEILDYSKFVLEEKINSFLPSHKASIDFWKNKLLNTTHSINLPYLQLHDEKNLFNGMKKEFQLESDVSEKLKLLSRELRTTPNILILSFFFLSLKVLSNQNNISIGVPITLRDLDEFDETIGMFANTIIINTDIDSTLSLTDFVHQIQKVFLESTKHKGVTLEEILKELPIKREPFKNPLFQIMYSYGDESQKSNLSEVLEVDLNVARYDLTLEAKVSDDIFKIIVAYNPLLLSENTVNCLVTSIRSIVLQIKPSTILNSLSIFEPPTLSDTLNESLNHSVEHVVGIIEDIAKKEPSRIALEDGSGKITYSNLVNRIKHVGGYLKANGIRERDLIAVNLKRESNLVITILGILSCKATYLPLDTNLPKERVEYIINDSKAKGIIVHEDVKLKTNIKTILFSDIEKNRLITENIPIIPKSINGNELVYVTYTSGTTGLPKGVMVEHSNLISTFNSFETLINHNINGKWFSVSSASFDISILELIWTLTKGVTVVLDDSQNKLIKKETVENNKTLDFSLFYFNSLNTNIDNNPYKLLLKSAMYADANGFTSIWTPERHFHEFGGIFPNPSVTSAALAMVTKNLEIRAGSVVLPLHNTIRVVEEWSLVDNLSNGRVGIAFASGWHPNDFVITDKPTEQFKNRKQIVSNEILEFKKYWKEQTVTKLNTTLDISPKPIRSSIPIWLTVSASEEAFKIAGENGYNILTHLLNQNISELQTKIQIYRDAWRKNGNEGHGKVTLMLHTYIDEDNAIAKEKVEKPLKNYLKESFNLISGNNKELKITDEDLDQVIQNSFNYYFEEAGLIGDMEKCLDILHNLYQIGINEIASLIDFGLDEMDTMNSLVKLTELKELFKVKLSENKDYYNTYYQCTPSRLELLYEEDNGETLGKIDYLFVGGEAFETRLLSTIRGNYKGEIYNLYGPTETTIWSAAKLVNEINITQNIVPLGNPLTGEELHLLDGYFNPVKKGEVGEIYIGGSGVTRGYLNRPKLTAEKFVPNPYSVQKGARMFKTGDLALLNNENELEFIGRADNQIKHNGYRIELNDIEENVMKHQSVKGAKVLYQDKKILCFIKRNIYLDRKQISTEDFKLVELPNGLNVCSLSSNQAISGYKELFEDDIYFKYGIKIENENTILDIGSNIGLFALQVATKINNYQLYCYEPIPTTYKVLQQNIGNYSINANIQNKGVSDKEHSC